MQVDLLEMALVVLVVQVDSAETLPVPHLVPLLLLEDCHRRTPNPLANQKEMDICQGDDLGVHLHLLLLSCC
jgi:hypothetical protein